MGSIMLNVNSEILFSTIANNKYQQNFWQEVRKESGTGGQFMIDMSLRYNPNRFISRDGEWSLPWNQSVPDKFKMPSYDPTFNKHFDQITDARALEIRSLIHQGHKFALMYSGGIDSTLAICALIKNLNKEELSNIVICASKHSIIENPHLWKKFIWGNFKIINSMTVKYDDLIEQGYRPITADEGDCIFGTVFGLAFYQHYDFYASMVSSESRAKLMSIKDKFDTTHYSEYKDIILKHFEIPKFAKNWLYDFDPVHNPNFAELWYNKMVKNIETSSVPIYSIHDFWWWMIFNLKYVNCAFRCSIYLNDRVDVGDAINNWVINWFNTDDYQRWSMVNNNNGEKIQVMGASTYKMASRRYIYDLDKNDWYFNFKLKIGSLGATVVLAQDVSKLAKDQVPNARFGVDKDYRVLTLNEPSVVEYIKHNMSNYKIDW
jgi:hypothetical protein